jgi:general stress protein 26
MIRSSTGRKEISIEALKKDIEDGKEITVRFVYAKKFLKIDGLAEIVQPS